MASLGNGPLWCRRQGPTCSNRTVEVPGHRSETPRRPPVPQVGCPTECDGVTVAGVTMAGVVQPRIGDAFGDIMRAALAEETGVGPRPTIGSRHPRPVIELVERDDGFLQGAPAARYLAAPADWLDFDRRAVDLARGRVLDIGVGAGRVALELQRRGLAVTGLDISP